MEFGKREKELKKYIEKYEFEKKNICAGIDIQEEIEKKQHFILQYFNATEQDWQNHLWQMKNSISQPEILGDLLDLEESEIAQIREVSQKYRFRITPYYLSLISNDRKNCPIWKMSVPSSEELSEKGILDPMNEEGTTVKEIITRRYPDRVILKITNSCAMFCRFCQRRRLIGEKDEMVSNETICRAIGYIRKNTEIRDVLITGGDPLTLSNEKLDWLLNEICSIEHVEIVRIGTRIPVTMPQRVTTELIKVLKKYRPLYMNLHFNHPREITVESKKVCEALAKAGIPLGNQSVLLNGVNNDEFIIKKLNQELLKIMVKPYYLFHPKTVMGTSHFWLSIKQGLSIMENLRGKTSGLAIPTYVFNVPGGKGKVPLLPQYIKYLDDDKIVLSNWEGHEYEVNYK